ncbi:MAG: zf-HC2 domain-containing protein [Vulcanimicrobiota bacterium]
MDNCRECQEIYSAWLDGEASPAEVQQMQLHIGACPECSRWTAEVRDLHLELRGDTSDYLDLASASLAELVLLEPAQSKLLPTPRQFLTSKILPTLVVAAWSALVMAAPPLFRCWPLLAVPVFGLTSSRSSRVRPLSLENGWRQALRPLGWGMLLGALLPASALCYREGNRELLFGLTGGLGLCLAAWAGALLGVLQVANPAAWRVSRTACWGLVAAALCLTWSHSLVETAVFLAISAAALVLGVKLALRGSHSMISQALPFYYPPALALLDVGGLLLPAAGWRLGFEQIASPAFIHYFGIGANGWGTLIPLGLCLWWVLVRNPLAWCYELSQGTSTRYSLGAFFGAALLAIPVLLGSFERTAEPSITIGLSGVVLGILLAFPGRTPVSSQRRAILRQRLVMWLLALAAVGLTGALGRVRLAGESARARALRQAAELRPQPGGENGYDWVSFELRNGLDADFDLAFVGPSGRNGRLLGYLSQNFEHIDHCLSCPDFRAPYESLDSNTYAQSISTALWLRAEADLSRGDWDTGVNHLISVARWEERIHCNGRPRDWWLPSQQFSQRLRHNLSGVSLNALEIRRLWDGLHCSDDLGSAVRHQLDLEYLRSRQNHAPNRDSYLIDLPPAGYDRLEARQAEGYLKWRDQGVEPGLKHQLNEFNLCRAGLSVALFQAEHGRLPADLREAGAVYPEIQYQRTLKQARLSLENQSEWIVPTGGRHE